MANDLATVKRISDQLSSVLGVNHDLWWRGLAAVNAELKLAFDGQQPEEEIGDPLGEAAGWLTTDDSFT